MEKKEVKEGEFECKFCGGIFPNRKAWSTWAKFHKIDWFCEACNERELYKTEKKK